VLWLRRLTAWEVAMLVMVAVVELAEASGRLLGQVVALAAAAVRVVVLPVVVQVFVRGACAFCS
jgi:hypothetical protein